MITRLNGTIGGENNVGFDSLLDIYHHYEQLDQPIHGVEDEKIHKNVPIFLKGMIFVDVGTPSDVLPTP